MTEAGSRALSLALLVCIAACGGDSSSPAGADAANTEVRRLTGGPATAPTGVVRLLRLEETGAAALARGSIWDRSNRGGARAPARPDDQLFAERGDAVRVGAEAALLRVIPVREYERLEWSLEGRAESGAPTAAAFALFAPLEELEGSRRPPLDLLRKVGREPLVYRGIEVDPGGEFREAVSLEVPRKAIAVMISVEAGEATSFELRSWRVETVVDRAPARRQVGGQTRVAMLATAGEEWRFSVGSAPARSSLTIAAAIPEQAGPEPGGVSVIAELVDGGAPVAGAGGRIVLRDAGEAMPVRVFEEQSFAFADGASEAAELVIRVEGREGAVVALAEPILSPPRRDGDPPGVLLISIDTLRADRLGCYGYERGLTPNLDRFAARAVRFERAYSPANYTLPAHASLMTGVQPIVHGAHRYGARVSIRSWPNLAGGLAGAGWHTVAFTGGGYVDAAFGFDEGFDRYGVLDVLMPESNSRFESGPRRHAPDYNRELRRTERWRDVLAWWRRHAGRRPFLFLHTYHAHDYCPTREAAEQYAADTPSDLGWNPRDKIGEDYERITAGSPELLHFERFYDATIADVDAALGHLFALLDETAAWDHTIVVITSDHGEAFREHEFLFHAAGLYDEVLRVPLLVAVPGGRPRVVTEPVSLIDVAPTLLDLCGVKPLEHAQGRSLRGLLEGEPLEPRALLAQDCPNDEELHSALVAGRHKLIQNQPPREPAQQFFDVVADPGERDDLAAARADEVSRAQKQLSRVLEAMESARRRATITAEEIATSAAMDEDLRALGYVGDR